MTRGFITLPILVTTLILLSTSFFLGMGYGEGSLRNPINTSTQSTEVSDSTSEENLIKRCGEIPDKAYLPYGHFDTRTGPEWSPDCRHIAWAMWESGTSYLGNDQKVIKEIEDNPKKLSGMEGVFLYKDSDKSVTKIYNPQELHESASFIKWEDSQNLIFKAKGKEYNYNLLTKEITELDQ